MQEGRPPFGEFSENPENEEDKSVEEPAVENEKNKIEYSPEEITEAVGAFFENMESIEKKKEFVDLIKEAWEKLNPELKSMLIEYVSKKFNEMKQEGNKSVVIFESLAEDLKYLLKIIEEK